MSELDVSQDLKQRVTSGWEECTAARNDTDDAGFWAGIVKTDQAMAETWHAVRRAVRPDPESVLGKLLLDAESFRRSEARRAREFVERDARGRS